MIEALAELVLSFRAVGVELQEVTLTCSDYRDRMKAGREIHAELRDSSLHPFTVWWDEHMKLKVADVPLVLLVSEPAIREREGL